MININRKEALRYMGFGANPPDEATLMMLEECIEEIGKAAMPRSIHRREALNITEDNYIQAAQLSFRSNNLAKNLKGCKEIIFFAATLGVDVDRGLNRYLKLNMAKAVVYQATAAAAIEAYCNECQHEIEEALSKEGLYVRPRFSPGYGDVPLSIQGQFLDVLKAYKTVGITLSDGDIMLPEKSVTAVMGISDEDSHCLVDGCEVCGKLDCMYRRCS